MPHTYDELKGMTVAQLREIAAETQHEAVQGYTQMNKEHLLDALCKALKIDTHTRHKAKLSGSGKAKIKSQMKELKIQRNAALEAHDHARLKEVRREAHKLKRKLRKSAGIKA